MIFKNKKIKILPNLEMRYIFCYFRNFIYFYIFEIFTLEIFQKSFTIVSYLK